MEPVVVDDLERRLVADALVAQPRPEWPFERALARLVGAGPNM